MTPVMLAKARRNAVSLGVNNTEFRESLAEDLLLEDDFVDGVISNGVINLYPDKETVYRELYRALKPGGRFMITDIIVQRMVSEEAKAGIAMWTS